MEDGRPITEGSKYKAAQQKKVKIINEDALLKMIRDSNPEASALSEAAQKEEMKREEAEAMDREESIMGDRNDSPSRLFTTKYAPTRLSSNSCACGCRSGRRWWCIVWLGRGREA